MSGLVRHTHVRPGLHNASDDSIPCIQQGTIIRQNSYPTAPGGLSDVYKCTRISSAGSDEVAVKSPRLKSLREDEAVEIIKNFHQDIRIWMTLKHQYLLPFYGTVEGFGPSRALVSPWMPNGDLKFYLSRVGATLMEIDKLCLLGRITEGLKYLHDNNVVHSNLTSNNVLIAADGSPRLSDFGFSNIVRQSNQKFSYYPNALRWVPPEFIVGSEERPIQDGTKSGDIYALGGIMLQVLYGKEPYWWIKNDVHIINAKSCNIEPINAPVQIHPSNLHFMRRCWSAESVGRPSVDDVLAFLQVDN